ncbi:LPS assembly protein LptD [Pelagibacteraceae bacterium]|nr:LPS assembly protein LptD [Pelagibacteraceae bacterium]
MKNNFFYIFVLIFIFFNLKLLSQELEISSSKIQYDDANKITILEGNVKSVDEKGNKIFSEYAKYNKIDGVIETVGETKIITSNGYEVLGSNVIFSDKKKIIYSNYKTQIIDNDSNKVFVDMFNYSIQTNIFFSKGNIEILDINSNKYNFSEIYIDEKKRKIIGSDAKAFLNNDKITIDGNNEPRLFANTMSLSKNVSTLDKGIFTYCKNRENEKCPPWALQSKKIKHDLAKKTIYYDNVVLKIYDFPIFFSPKFSHPDPTVKRRSGLLVPSLNNSSTLGSGFSLPYFWDIKKDRDVTFTPKIYLTENPLMLAQYRQAFYKSFLFIDSGYTQGYKKTDNKKTPGGRSHFFVNYIAKLIEGDEKKSTFELNLQKVSNDTYFKIYDINTALIKSDLNILESTANYTYQNKDFYFNLNPSFYEDITKIGNQRYEYLLPLSIEKNLIVSEKYGFTDISSELKIRNYDTNKHTNFLVNDFNWKSKKWLSNLGFDNQFLGLAKTVNYKAAKTTEYKNKQNNSELQTALGFFSKLALYKNDNINKNIHTLTPKFLLRYAPGHMRNIEGGRLNYRNLFNINKVDKFDVVESGLSTSIGFDYKKNQLDSGKNVGELKYSFSAGQVISAEENLDMPSSTTLDQKFSDVVGKANFKINNQIDLNYDFSLDQNYKNFNYNEIGTNINFDTAKFNVSYLQEKNHIGNQEFIQSKVDLRLNNATEISLSGKRNLLTRSSEFYNLSYNYINDCLKAGIAYRREFYTDRDIEPKNNLMFTISIVPFAEINSPSFTK